MARWLVLLDLAKDGRDKDDCLDLEKAFLKKLRAEMGIKQNSHADERSSKRQKRAAAGAQMEAEEEIELDE